VFSVRCVLRAVVFTVRAVTVILCVFVLYVFVLLISKFAGWRCAYCVLNVRFCGLVRNVKCVLQVSCVLRVVGYVRHFMSCAVGCVCFEIAIIFSAWCCLSGCVWAWMCEICVYETCCLCDFLCVIPCV